MIKKFSMTILLVVFITFLSFQGAFSDTKGSEGYAGNISFSIRLFDELKKNNNKNIFFSPYSIRTALAMTYEGAKGKTKEEMANVLNFPYDLNRLHSEIKRENEYFKGIQEKGEIELNIANSLWLQKGYPILDSYFENLKEYYSIIPFQVDFIHETEKVRKEINLWVERETKKKITKLIRPKQLKPNTTLVLCNAIYFKGSWLKGFDKKNTFKAPFYIDGKQQVQTDFMNQEGDFKFLKLQGLSTIELPYKGKDLSMVIFLPEKRDGLKEMENELSPKRMEEILTALSKVNGQEVKVIIPKFKMTCSFELSRALSDMGMPHAFRDADFSGIDGQRDLFIGSVIHKAHVDVNEEGTVAAAATAVVVTRMAMPEKYDEIIFRADHPFLFLIKDNRQNQILFFGRVTKPI